MRDRKLLLEHFEAQRPVWEKRAKEGIEAHRKGVGTLAVVDREGHPVPNAKIKLKQKSHAFRFGANLFMLDELETPKKNELYKQYFTNVFNMATLPFYWDTLEPEKGNPRYSEDSAPIYRRPPIDRCMRFCEENGIEPREHALAYDHFFPSWLRGASDEEVKRELTRRYGEIAERYADRIPTIEVTNEMYWPDGVTDFYTRDTHFVDWCFCLAEKYFPNNCLCINEATETAWHDRCRVTDKYYTTIALAMARGARIDAVGMQYHMFHRQENEYKQTRTAYNPDSLYRHMDLYATFGKPIHITEITVPAYSWEKEDEEVQADIIEMLYTIWFSHPAVEQIVYWNLVDGYAHFWDPDPKKILASQGDMTLGENYYYGGLLRFDLSPKPAYLRLVDLIHKRWHTECELVSDAEGKASFCGFYGTYDVEITVGESTVTRTLALSKGSDQSIVLEV